jgi:hypothetical protein
MRAVSKVPKNRFDLGADEKSVASCHGRDRDPIHESREDLKKGATSHSRISASLRG